MRYFFALALASILSVSSLFAACPPGFTSGGVVIVNVGVACSIEYTVCYRWDPFPAPSGTLSTYIDVVKLVGGGCGGVDPYSEDNLGAMVDILIWAQNLQPAVKIPACPDHGTIFKMSWGECRTGYVLFPPTSQYFGQSISFSCNSTFSCYTSYSACYEAGVAGAKKLKLTKIGTFGARSANCGTYTFNWSEWDPTIFGQETTPCLPICD